ncbi:hypothetical protein E3U43_014232 [Larimichthys crocea]|uniref:Uncharacterized protein n=1 Tax=Larimichthys crocea TaxID=215358 RepID=A0ACD3RE45_LARCR|nr:hypothetical protein E3U43_014232 [Larimichthys crocea]
MEQMSELTSWLQQQTKKRSMKTKKKIWAHVHWYDRSTRLVTVSGTYKHTTPEAQEAVCIPNEPRHTKTLRGKHPLTRTVIDPLPFWSSRVSRPPPPLVSQ